MPKVIIHDAIDRVGIDLLETRADLEICTIERDDDPRLMAEIVDADGLILRYLPLRAEPLEAATRLKVVARHGVGCDNVDLAVASARKIPVATVGDANAVTVAELTLFFMLSAAKRGRHYDEAMRRGDYLVREAADHGELYERTVLIIGFGRIGHPFAHLPRGPVGEGHGKHLIRPCPAKPQQMRKAGREDTGLARPRPGQHQHGTLKGLHRLALRRVELRQPGGGRCFGNPGFLRLFDVKRIAHGKR